MFAKKDTNSSAAFMKRLGKIDHHLEKRKTRYLTGDTLCCFDCELMTRLQHIRVAGKNCILLYCLFKYDHNSNCYIYRKIFFRF